MLTPMRAAACALMAALAVPAAGHADEFYKNKTVTFVVGFSINNGYDAYARAISRVIGRYLPGHPSVVVQNMPGAASVAAINYLYNAAPKDGTIVGMIDQSAALTQALDPKSLRADVAKFNWIGRATDNSAVLYSWHTAPVQKIQDAFEKNLIVATNGQSSRMLSALMKNLLGMRLVLVNGYQGAAEAALAMERGEIEALTQPYPVLRADKPEWLRDKLINLLLQVGVDSHPDLKGVPLITELARNEDQRAIIELVAGNSRVGRSFLSPPGEPAERVAEMRAAFMKSMTDPDFLDEIKRAQLDLSPMPGEELQKIIEKAVAAPPDLAARTRALTEFGG